MSYYDVYTVNARPDGSPTAFVMALKAQDPIRLFEDPDKDFIHFFALESADLLRHAVLTFRAARVSLVYHRFYLIRTELHYWDEGIDRFGQNGQVRQ